MRKIISMMMGITLLVLPMILNVSYGATGHSEGCTNTGYDTNCCTKTFSITAKPGYRIVNVLVNGISQGIISTYTFDNTPGTQILKIITEKIENAATYTVTYNANGGGGIPAQQTKTHGTSLTLSDTIPTREGYEFVCWNTASDGSGVNYNPEATYDIDDNLTLYAKWTVITYTVSYNANGGGGAPATQTKTYGNNLTLSSDIPTRVGYTFKGWSTTSSMGAPEYLAGGTYTENESKTLHAMWTQTVSSEMSVAVSNGGETIETNTKTLELDLTGVSLLNFNASRYCGYGNSVDWDIKLYDKNGNIFTDLEDPLGDFSINVSNYDYARMDMIVEVGECYVKEEDRYYSSDITLYVKNLELVLMAK